MLFYITEETKQSFNLSHIDELPSDQRNYVKNIYLKDSESIFIWSVKVFHYKNRRCVQVMHQESLMTLFIYDLRDLHVQTLSEYVGIFIKLMLEDDEELLQFLEFFLSDGFMTLFEPLESDDFLNKLVVNEESFLLTDWFLDEYTTHSIVDAKTLHLDYNTKPVDGNDFTPLDRFKELLRDYYQ